MKPFRELLQESTIVGPDGTVEQVILGVESTHLTEKLGKWAIIYAKQHEEVLKSHVDKGLQESISGMPPECRSKWATFGRSSRERQSEELERTSFASANARRVEMRREEVERRRVASEARREREERANNQHPTNSTRTTTTTRNAWANPSRQFGGPTHAPTEGPGTEMFAAGIRELEERSQDRLRAMVEELEAKISHLATQTNNHERLISNIATAQEEHETNVRKALGQLDRIEQMMGESQQRTEQQVLSSLEQGQRRTEEQMSRIANEIVENVKGLIGNMQASRTTEEVRTETASPARKLPRREDGSKRDATRDQEGRSDNRYAVLEETEESDREMEEQEHETENILATVQNRNRRVTQTMTSTTNLRTQPRRNRAVTRRAAGTGRPRGGNHSRSDRQEENTTQTGAKGSSGFTDAELMAIEIPMDTQPTANNLELITREQEPMTEPTTDEKVWDEVDSDISIEMNSDISILDTMHPDETADSLAEMMNLDDRSEGDTTEQLPATNNPENVEAPTLEKRRGSTGP